MKKKKDVVKSFLTLGGLGCLYLITFVAFVKVSMTENIFMLVFTLFSNVITSITTYYFTRQNNKEKSDE